MIENRGIRVSLICDDCESEDFGPYDRDDFGLMMQEAKEAGWTISKPGGAWHHRCPDCKPSALERARDLFGV